MRERSSSIASAMVWFAFTAVCTERSPWRTAAESAEFAEGFGGLDLSIGEERSATRGGCGATRPRQPGAESIARAARSAVAMS